MADEGTPEASSAEVDPEELTHALGVAEAALLGAPPTLTRVEVAERAGVPLELASELWHLLGFAHVGDDTVAFNQGDVDALDLTWDLLQMGVIGADSQAALVRTWGRSFARLAEWQTNLLAGIAAEADEPVAQLENLVVEVLPRVERLQSYIWRRHLMSATSRLVSVGVAGSPGVTMAVCFVDIVGYTTRSKNLTEPELVDWIEGFEQEATGVVVDHGARVIKMIGDEIMFVADDPAAAAEVALVLTERGSDEDDPFPSVRAGIAHGEVVNRLGDVFGPTVNIAARLTSVARPGTVLIDRPTYEALRPSSADGNDPFDPEVLAQNVAKVLDVLTPAKAERADEGDGVDPEQQEARSDLEISADEPTQPLDVAGDGEDETSGGDDETPRYRFRRMRRVTVKGYARLETWALRRPRGQPELSHP
ncbi:adenylate/guanylate cyclase domain-containing protein [Nocardioides sp.]|uniref:adenylate/guanylate cyclase domain-containing protein n=1 Tax=Nocardioides sp. TaxID=35761 RepID=UPI00273760C0|nr:adenylate/guanylate cyclase domain-containing protein [Nocardioides sp.]MDP3894963.1 adenylate/guanylate cyclase domain-containing protein [Nocardioides sp.]